MNLCHLYYALQFGKFSREWMIPGLHFSDLLCFTDVIPSVATKLAQKLSTVRWSHSRLCSDGPGARPGVANVFRRRDPGEQLRAAAGRPAGYDGKEAGAIPTPNGQAGKASLEAHQLLELHAEAGADRATPGASCKGRDNRESSYRFQFASGKGTCAFETQLQVSHRVCSLSCAPKVMSDGIINRYQQ